MRSNRTKLLSPRQNFRATIFPVTSEHTEASRVGALYCTFVRCTTTRLLYMVHSYARCVQGVIKKLDFWSRFCSPATTKHERTTRTHTSGIKSPDFSISWENELSHSFSVRPWERHPNRDSHDQIVRVESPVITNKNPTLSYTTFLRETTFSYACTFAAPQILSKAFVSSLVQ